MIGVLPVKQLFRDPLDTACKERIGIDIAGHLRNVRANGWDVGKVYLLVFSSGLLRCRLDRIKEGQTTQTAEFTALS
jgi:hypothetical protein